MPSTFFPRAAACLFAAGALVLTPLTAGATSTSSAIPASSTAGSEQRGETRGSLASGSRYVLLTPADWNGTLLVWSPGYSGSAGGEAVAGPDADVISWLLDEGYALAGSKPSTSGWSVQDLLVDQPQLADVAGASLGEPEHVVAWGSSMGGLTSVALLENHPSVFDAALPLCGSVAGTIPMLNQALDGAFALRMLLAPYDDRLELVDVQDEPQRQAAFREVLDEAQKTPQGRARIALAASLAQIVLALNTGVPGAGTVHANSAVEALEKLTILPLLAGRNIDRSFIAPALAASVSMVVHCTRDAAGARRVTEVIAPTGEIVEGRIITRTIYRAEPPV